MTSLQYSFSSNAYKSNLFSGFSQLQKQEEFVDLTLAADGCLVKVHRNIIALASPYLREILKSMPNHPPVIYLYNVRHEVLSYLLEYIYQGEVNVPEVLVHEFIEVSKSLHIAGIEDLEPPKMTHHSKLSTQRNKPRKRRASNIDAHTTISNDNLLKPQQYPKDKTLENIDYNYETDYSMEDLQQSADVINNAKFIIQDQSDHLNQESTNTQPLENIPVIEFQTANRNTTEIQTNAGLLDHNPLQLQTNNTRDQQNLSKGTIQNIPIIEITSSNITSDQHIIENNAQLKDYKIIVKAQNDTAQNSEASQNDIPVIEIQQVSQTSIPCHQDHNLTIQDDESLLPVQTDAITQEENPTIPQIDTTPQHYLATSSISSPVIKILDDKIVKLPDTSEPYVAGHQNIPVKSNVVTDVLPSHLKVKINDLKNMALYSLTERGALQLILNRYIYCCHHTTRLKRRWRCIEYRRVACHAIVDTKDGAIVARKGVHTHAFHDEKIYKKHRSNLIYYSDKLAIASRDSKQREKQRMLSTEEMDTINE